MDKHSENQVGITIRKLYKIFGPTPERHLDAVMNGMDKATLRDTQGHVLGLRDINLEIRPGEIQVVMGLSGSGKSTLIRHINRLIEPTAGEILIGGKNVLEMGARELRRFRSHSTAMVFQKFALFPHYTVLENAEYGLRVQGVSGKKRHQAARQWIERVGLAGYEQSYPNQLSGGMQQRVGLARALTADPEIILMDEPFSALDPLIRRQLQDEFRQLTKALGKSAVFITHDLDEAMRIGDRIAIMKDGQVVQVGTPDEILRSPANDYVRSFVRGVDAAAVFKAGDIARQRLTVVREHSDRGCRAALQLLEGHDDNFAYVVSPTQRYLGTVSADSLRAALHGHHGPLGLQHAYLADVPPIPSDAAVANLFGQVAHAPCALPVVDGNGRFRGAISKTTLLRFLDRDTPPLPPDALRSGHQDNHAGSPA